MTSTFSGMKKTGTASYSACPAAPAAKRAFSLRVSLDAVIFAVSIFLFVFVALGGIVGIVAALACLNGLLIIFAVLGVAADAFYRSGSAGRAR